MRRHKYNIRLTNPVLPRTLANVRVYEYVILIFMTHTFVCRSGLLSGRVLIGVYYIVTAKTYSRNATNLCHAYRHGYQHRWTNNQPPARFWWFSFTCICIPICLRAMHSRIRWNYWCTYIVIYCCCSTRKCRPPNAGWYQHESCYTCTHQPRFIGCVTIIRFVTLSLMIMFENIGLYFNWSFQS